MGIISLVLFFLLGSQISTARELLPVVDLGDDGNAFVVNRYLEYFHSGVRCDAATSTGTKVLITGFGLFSSAPSNISSAVTKSAMDARHLPDIIDTEKWPARAGTLARGHVEDPTGVDSALRRLTINGRDYTVCFLALDVIWDFAAAVIVTEMQIFQPDAVIMMGRGTSSITIERGVTNHAAALSGYGAQGEPEPLNRPVSPLLFKEAPDTLSFTVDQKRIAKRVSPVAHELGLEVRVPDGPRPTNDYVCNNVGYVAQYAANENRLALAGGLLPLNPHYETAPEVGFIHLADASNVAGEAHPWIKFIVSILESVGPKKDL